MYPRRQLLCEVSFLSGCFVFVVVWERGRQSGGGGKLPPVSDSFLDRISRRAPSAPLWKAKVHTKTCSSFSFSALAPGLMATCGMDKTVKLWVSRCPVSSSLLRCSGASPPLAVPLLSFPSLPMPLSLTVEPPHFRRIIRAIPASPRDSWERKRCPSENSSPSPSIPGGYIAAGAFFSSMSFVLFFVGYM